MEEDTVRANMFLSLKERGNLAMQRNDLTAARDSYSEALEISQIADDVSTPERFSLLLSASECF